MPQERKTPRRTTFRVWLPIVASPLGLVLGRYVGKYIFTVLGPDPAHLVRGSLYDNMTWGGIYGGVGAFLAAWLVESKSPRWSFWLALAVSLAGGVLFVVMLLIKAEDLMRGG